MMSTATAELVCERTMALPDGTVLETTWNLRRVGNDGAAHRFRPVVLVDENEQNRLRAFADARLARAGWYRTGDWTPVDDHDGVAAPEMLAAPIARGDDVHADALDYTNLPGWTPGPGGLTSHRVLPDGARLELSGPFDRTGYLVEGTDREAHTFRRWIRGGQAALADARRLAMFLPVVPGMRRDTQRAVRNLLERNRSADR